MNKDKRQGSRIQGFKDSSEKQKKIKHTIFVFISG